MLKSKYKPIKLLPKDVANKIAAGEVIERPASVVRELLDNAIDAGATKITLEITGGGIDSIRVCDNGCGMTKEDLEICTHTYSTSKITDVEDLLHLTSLGFRGEALASIQAVSSLEITSTRTGPNAWKFFLDRIIPARLNTGTIVDVKNLFENFPARKKFLKRAQYEASQCKQIFIEKALPHFNIEMRYSVDGINRIILPQHNSLKERCLQAMGFNEPEELFYEIKQEESNFSFSAVLGTPDIVRSDKRNIYIFVNGRRINEYGLVQAVSYGAEGYFPNGGFPIVFLFLTVNPERIDFNIHPAKKEARFEDYKEIHHSISSTISSFYKQKTVATLLKDNQDSDNYLQSLNFAKDELNSSPHYSWTEKSAGYYNMNPTFNSFKADGSVKNSLHFTDKYLAENKTSNTQFRYQNSVSNPKSFAEVYDKAVQYNHENRYSHDNANLNASHILNTDFKFLGQFCGTFIAVEKNDSLYIIDQHAAHERLIFEELKKNLGSSQELLIPYKIETDCENDDNLIKANIDDLKKAGFNLTQEKPGMWIITAVPIRWHGTEKELHDDLADAGKDPLGLMHHILATSACRAACKDGDIIDPVFAYNIAVKTFALPEPLCPHGRPLYFVITRDELFARIKRT